MHEQQQIFDSPIEFVQQASNTPNLEDRSKIKQILLQTFMILTHPSPTQQSLNQCHKKIGQYQKLECNLQIMFELITQMSTQNETITKLIITQVFTYMKKQSSFGYEARHDKSNIVRLFLQFFLETKVEYKFKKMLQNSFMQFIYTAHNIKLRQQVVKYVDDKVTRILSCTKESLTQLKQYNKLSSPVSIFVPSCNIANEENLRMAFCLMHVLRGLFVGGNLELELMKSILANCFSIYYRMTVEITKIVISSITSKQEALFVSKVDQCEKFVQMLLLMFAKTDTGKFPTLRQRILHTKQLYQLILVLLNLSTSFQSFQIAQKILQQPLNSNQQSNKQTVSLEVSTLVTQLCFQQNFLNIPLNIQNIQISSKKTLSNLIIIKNHSIQILIKCIKTLQRKKDQFLSDYQYLTAILVNIWMKVKDCLISETERFLKSVQGQSDTQPINMQMRKQLLDLFGVSLKFLSQTVNLSPLYNIVSPYQNEIIFKLCFPWLISRKTHDKFEAEDYLFFREDIVNKQNMSYIENNIASLLESYLDNIDGTVTTIMVNCTGLISYHLTKNTQILEGLAHELKNSWMVQFYQTERQIESALTLIAVESYHSLRRNDIALLLQKWLNQNKAFFLQVNNDYRITVQFLMMYSYYSDNFYQNMIKGISSLNFQYRTFHQQVLRFCCFLMTENYDYEKNNYKGRLGQILYFQALDCLNNSLNHTQLVPVLYCNFPPKEELSIPNYMQPYENYPFYPVQRLKQSPKKQSNETQLNQPIYDYQGRPLQKQAQLQTNTKDLLIHYRKLGLNKDEYIDKTHIVDIMQFLTDNLQSRANIKIIDILIEYLIGYIKQEMKHQGSLLNIPVVFREDIPTLLVVKLYSLIYSKPNKLPNRGLFEAKATELIYVLHSIGLDPYYIYSLGLEIVWMNPEFWNFDPAEDDNNVDKLLKCTDLVVRLALKHFSSEKGVNVPQLIQKIANAFVQHSYLYIGKIHKFNIVFGILLNIILLKVNPQQMFEFLYLLITEKLIKAELKQSPLDRYQEDNNQIPVSSASDLLGQAFYLFLVNIYRNPTCLNTEKNFKLLTVFTDYLTHFVNAHRIVTQLGDLFGKIFACCLCILQKEYLNNTLGGFDKNTLEFLWRNILYSGKIYKSELQTRIVSIKLLSLVKQIVKRNDPDFSLERVQQMYQVSCSCVFYSKNKDFLMNNDEEGQDEDFDHAGDEQEWQNSPITMTRNDTELYIEDEVLTLKKTSRQLLESSNVQVKQWVARLIEGLPIAVKNFVKNKVINYDQESKQIGLRKIIKVKRPQNQNMSGVTKQQVVEENLESRKENDNDQYDV